MLRIILNGNELELSQNEQIALTYQMSDLDNPTTEKNTFSKTIEINGTPRNNKIFGEYWRLDRVTLESPDGVGVSFDARKRADASIFDKNDLIEDGYIQLNKVSVNKGQVTYEITFFGGIGNFFYNLMYDDNGVELSLKDLYYKLKKDNGDTYTKEEEDNALLALWNKDYIVDSWAQLGIPPYEFGTYTSEAGDYNDDGKIHSYLTACPTYSGYYDDFDNNKVLVNTYTFYYSDDLVLKNLTLGKYLPESLTDDEGKKYYTNKGWALIETPRELDEWEVGVLNSSMQRPAVKLKWILDACCDKDNNGGYNVIWDKEITDKNTQIGKYYHNAYLLMNRFDFEATENKFQKKVEFEETPILSKTVSEVSSNIVISGTSSLNVSDLATPTATMTFQPQMNFAVSSFGKDGRYPEEMYNEFKYSNTWFGTYVAFQAFTYDGSTLIDISPVYASYSDAGQNINVPKDRVKEIIGNEFYTDGKNVVLKKDSLKASSTSMIGNEEFVTYAFDGSGIQVELPQSDNARIEVVSKVIAILAQPYQDGKGKPFESSVWKNRPDYINLGWKDGESVKMNGNLYDIRIGMNEDKLNAVYAGAISPTVQNLYVDKNVLFGNSKSPFEYLTSFTKMLGLKFYYESYDKTIRIMTRNNYFKNEVVDFSSNIDRSKTIDITPCLTEYKWYEWGLETPDSYAKYLYSLKNKNDYGALKFDTSYYFNKETNEILEGNVYQNVIPYRMSSIYFNYIAEKFENSDLAFTVPKPVLSKTYTYTLWNNDETYSETKYGYNAYYKLNRAYDYQPKLCCFDNNNGNLSDLSDGIVLFDGLGGLFDICDNLQIMYDLNGNPCHIWSDMLPNGVLGKRKGYAGIDDFEMTNISYFTFIPKFSKYHTDKETTLYDASLDFVKPNQTFIDDSTIYVDGITIDNIWSSYIRDFYDKDGKKVTAYALITENPKEAMRKFYFFDNCIWILNKISDYKPRVEKPLQCEFIKIVSVDNYTSNMAINDTYSKIIPREHKEHYYSDPVVCKCHTYAPTPSIVSTTTEVISSGQSTSTIDARGGDLYVTYTVLTTTTYEDGRISETKDERSVVITIGENYEKAVITKYGTIEDGDLRIDWSVRQLMEENVAKRVFRLTDYNYPRTVEWDVTSVEIVASGSVSTTYFDGTRTTQLVTTAFTVTFDKNETNEPIVRRGDFCFGDYCLVYEITQDTKEKPQPNDEIWYTTTDGLIIDIPYVQMYNPIVSNTYENGKGIIKLTNEFTGFSYNYVFRNKETLETISIPNTVADIGENTFQDCINLKRFNSNEDGVFNIPTGVTEFKREVFNHCTNMTSISVPTGITAIGTSAFDSCAFESFTIPSGVTEIKLFAFQNNEALKEIKFLDGMTNIGLFAFSNCTSLTSVTIPNSVTSIGTYAFRNVPLKGDLYCSRLWYNNLTADQIRNLGNVYNWRTHWVEDEEGGGNDPIIPPTDPIDPDNPPSGGDDDNPTNPVIYPSNDEIWYTTTDGYEIDKSIYSYYTNVGEKDIVSHTYTDKGVFKVNGDITAIGNEDFYKQYTLETIYIPSGITKIGEYAFASAHNLKSLNSEVDGVFNIPSGVTQIGNGAFQDCRRLKEITIPEGVTQIPYGLFAYCSGLTSVTIPESCTYIGEFTFKECAFESITLPSGITRINNETFEACDKLKSITIPSGVTYIGNYAFAYCRRLENITIPNSVTSIGNNVFDEIPTTGDLYCNEDWYLKYQRSLGNLQSWTKHFI